MRFFYFNLTVCNLFWAHILYKTECSNFVLFQHCFAPLGSLQFHVNLITCFSIYVKMGGEILIEIAYIGSDLDSIDLSVCPLIQKHRMSSFLFGYFKFLLFILYIFQCTSSFIALLTFICRYLVLSDAIENGTGFYTFRHGFSLLWYRNSTDFCMLIL